MARWYVEYKAYGKQGYMGGIEAADGYEAIKVVKSRVINAQHFKVWRDDFSIDDDSICGEAWQCAIKNVAKALGLDETESLRDNWAYIEEVAKNLNVRFDCNGEIIK